MSSFVDSSVPVFGSVPLFIAELFLVCVASICCSIKASMLSTCLLAKTDNSSVDDGGAAACDCIILSSDKDDDDWSPPFLFPLLPPDVRGKDANIFCFFMVFRMAIPVASSSSPSLSCSPSSFRFLRKFCPAFLVRFRNILVSEYWYRFEVVGV